MTTGHFVTLESVLETSDGLLARFQSGERGLLLRDNESHERIKELFRIAKSLSERMPWPVRLVRLPDGVIVSAWPAWRGRVFVVDEEPSGDCTAYFLLLNSAKTLKRDHPEFLRLLQTLMQSAGEKRDVFYFEVPGQKNVLADVCLAN